MGRRRKSIETVKPPSAVPGERNLVFLAPQVPRRKMPAEKGAYGECTCTALVPMLDIYSARAILSGVEASFEQRMAAMEERLNEKIKERDWRLMERIRKLQEQPKQKRPWWRWWDR